MFRRRICWLGYSCCDMLELTTVSGGEDRGFVWSAATAWVEVMEGVDETLVMARDWEESE